MRSGWKNPISEKLVNLVFMSPSASLRAVRLIDRPFSSRDQPIAFLFPNLEALDFALYPFKSAAWDPQEQEIALTEAVE
jgi:hypothetical protein